MDVQAKHCLFTVCSMMQTPNRHLASSLLQLQELGNFGQQSRDRTVLSGTYIAERPEVIKAPTGIGQLSNQNGQATNSSKGNDGRQDEDEKGSTSSLFDVLVNTTLANPGTGKGDTKVKDGVAPWNQPGGDKHNGNTTACDDKHGRVGSGGDSGINSHDEHHWAKYHASSNTYRRREEKGMCKKKEK